MVESIQQVITINRSEKEIMLHDDISLVGFLDFLNLELGNERITNYKLKFRKKIKFIKPNDNATISGGLDEMKEFYRLQESLNSNYNTTTTCFEDLVFRFGG